VSRRSTANFVSGDKIDSTLSVDFSELLTSQGEWNSPPGFICLSFREGSMEKREILASASDVIVVALKIFGYRKDGTCYQKM